MNDILVSVIIPVYNSGKYLNNSLSSMIKQTHKNLELLLCNDGSTDDSLNICYEYANNDPRIKVINCEHNRGCSYARNQGIIHANGEYLYFMDSDDIAHKRMIETLLKIMLDYDSDCSIVGFSYDCLPEPNFDEEVIIYNSHDSIKELHSGRRFQGHIWSKLFRRNLIQEDRFDELISINEDMLFCQAYFLKCNKVAYKNVKLYNYQNNGVSLYNGCYRKKDLTAIAACLKMKELGMSVFPDLVSYYDKSLLVAEMYVARKLSFEKEPNIEVINRIQADVRRLWHEETIAIFKRPSDVIQMKIFKKSWRLYFFVIRTERKKVELKHSIKTILRMNQQKHKVEI